MLKGHKKIVGGFLLDLCKLVFIGVIIESAMRGVSLENAATLVAGATAFLTLCVCGLYFSLNGEAV